ncbi:MAG TPA: oligopeptide transporter, OPT family [Steroidobacteraceae bacterium]|jgi:putative OPT family oligopeptide transporter|nr:oligopeptide transporter, OPT family [Steroidobacteraceae bacterium]
MSQPSSNPPQMTLRAIVLAIILAMLLAAGNAYIGLFAGLTIASAIPAAVISMAVLRALGKGGILENNIVSTGASAGCSIASGIIFTMPALVFLGAWKEFDYWWTLAIGGLGGLLGVLFSVPLRRSLVVEQRMAFPEGQAAAEVLRAGDNPSAGVKVLGGAAAAGGALKLLAASGLKLIPDTAAWASYVGKGIAYMGTNLSPALVGVGYIVGANVGAVMLAGGIIAWNIAIPIYAVYFLDGNPELAHAVAGLSAADAAAVIRAEQIRYLGVGAMLIGGVWTLWTIRGSILSGIRSGLAATRAGVADALLPTERDLPMKYVLGGIVLFTLPLAALYYAIVDNLGVATAMTIIMILAGFVFCSVGGYLAGLVGSSNSPISGITICTILFAALVLTLMLGRDSSVGPVATIMIGAVVCCAASIAGDNLQDLKAGHMIGASPWRQQVMIGIGAIAVAVIMAPTLNLFLHAYGMGPATPEHPRALASAQASLMESVARGMFGGHLPWGMVMTGIATGAGIIVVDEILKRTSKTGIRSPVLAAAVGIYLPLELEVPIFLGGLLSWYVQQRLLAGSAAATHSPEEIERLNRKGMLFAAGLITGEALLGVLIAILIVVSHRDDLLALPESLQFGGWLGLLLLAGLMWLLYRTATSVNTTVPPGEPATARE